MLSDKEKIMNEENFELVKELMTKLSQCMMDSNSKIGICQVALGNLLFRSFKDINLPKEDAKKYANDFIDFYYGE